jgi:hypothetical protein
LPDVQQRLDELGFGGVAHSPAAFAARIDKRTRELERK